MLMQNEEKTDIDTAKEKEELSVYKLSEEKIKDGSVFEPGKSLSLADIVNIGADAKKEIQKKEGNGLVVDENIQSAVGKID